MPRRGIARASALCVAAMVALSGTPGCAPGPGEPQRCLKREDCSPREYCARPIAECETAGVCRPRPEICLQLYAPVCGCDGVEYSNACKAAARGASAERADTCPGD